MSRLVGVSNLFRKAAHEWSADNAPRLSAALAFYSILSIAPLFVIVVSIAGMVLGEEAARGGLVDQIRGLVGQAGAEVVETTLANAKHPGAGIIATLVGTVTLLLGASGVFGELHDAMNLVWNVREKPGGGFFTLLRDKLTSFGLVLAVGFLLLVSLVLSAALAGLASYLSTLIPGLPTLMEAVNLSVSFLAIAALFALLFRYLPDIHVPWRDVWFGGLVTSFLFTIGKFAIGMYLAKAAVGSPFGAAGSLVVFVVWVYYSALIVFFGAELAQAHAEKRGSAVEPTERAEWIPELPETHRDTSRAARKRAEPDVTFDRVRP